MTDDERGRQIYGRMMGPFSEAQRCPMWLSIVVGAVLIGLLLFGIFT